MEKRRLGNTDLDLTVIGLGTWAIGGEWAYGWGPQDDADSEACILEALEAGINWLDTAPAYGIGHSEVVVGRALKKWRERSGEAPVVATKCGLIGQPDRSVIRCIKRASIFDECEQSLRRLGVERIDLYQIHWPSPPGDIGEAFQALLDLKKEGKIRWAGVSNFSRPQLEHISQYGVVSSLQPPYSMVNRAIEENLLDWCVEHGTGVIAYSPLQCGLLTGKVTREWIDSLAPGDWRKTKSDFFQEPKLSQSLSFIAKLKRAEVIAPRPLSDLALQWLLSRKGVTAAICGARRPGQIMQLLSAFDRDISAAEIEAIDQIFAEEFPR